ncbi:poly-gamma-glutamate biosynthesis protein PgsC [Leptospira sp. GIMC2001]|uniref:poly-gamma-glutamate biosynthesis protein PgsC n=1 Tax=Leptospira sp. GIMC2001 TaxID=1513297 RepID=UPI00234A64BD|nr:poly-gamma-glutamate biosynthesis protein PgsC [Leptospira sp. GIMC2001]WCL49980.1 poly-gamma-glutamate biosynthesis protein PgsC [Leptospira sp. GIMC2001]
MNVLILSIGLGLVISLLFSELFGLVAGGLIVPGYFALKLNQPLSIIVTIAIAFATFAISKLLSSFLILYGKRRTVFMIILGFFIGMLVDYFFVSWEDAEPIGYILPGLIAIWLDRQGIVETISTLIIVSIVIRLMLILIVGEDIQAL